MSLSGPQALSSLDEAVRDIRREEDELAKRLTRSAEVIAKVRESEADLLRQLATFRLAPQMQAEFVGQVSDAEMKAREAFKRHSEQLAAAEQELKDLDASVVQLTAERASVLAELERSQRELATFSEKIAQGLKDDPRFKTAEERATELRAVAEESMAKTLQAEADREKKGRPYRDDPLFMYLWERGYGTSKYKANNLVRWLDSLVARQVGYADARPNFLMLSEIPVRLREHAERQAQNAHDAAKALEAMQAGAIDAAGGKALRDAVAAAQARIAAIDEKIVAAEDRREDCAALQRELSQGSDPVFAKSIEAFAAELGREDLKVLQAEARTTRSGQDDTIVAQIEDARQRAKEEEDGTREQKDRLKTLAARRRELEDIQWEFKKARFDDPRSTFREDNLVGDVLNQFLRGSITADSYWQQWRRSQNWSSGSSDWGGGFGLPRDTESPWSGGGGFDWPDNSFGGGEPRRDNRSSGGFSWPKSSSGGGGISWNRPSSSGGGGGFSRPRTGSSGSRSHGGFKTGGGF